ncbi:hypothetical protein K438DRAFT_2102483 [Mycena galopus ATCC 62051]|nr:hypothetical protein K438DRAFT_2102483 [Mycena galopus ATCC 62051]
MVPVLYDPELTLWHSGRQSHPPLPREIFAIDGALPTWPGADDDDMGLQSISGPEEEVWMDDGNVSSTSHGVSTSPFSHMHQRHNCNSTTHSASTSSSGARSEEVDTEEGPVTPITPLPKARFEFSGALLAPSKDRGKGTGRDAYAELEDDDGFVDANGEVEIEDDGIEMVRSPFPIPSRSGWPLAEFNQEFDILCKRHCLPSR